MTTCEISPEQDQFCLIECERHSSSHNACIMDCARSSVVCHHSNVTTENFLLLCCTMSYCNVFNGFLTPSPTTSKLTCWLCSYSIVMYNYMHSTILLVVLHGQYLNIL